MIFDIPFNHLDSRSGKAGDVDGLGILIKVHHALFQHMFQRHDQRGVVPALHQQFRHIFIDVNGVSQLLIIKPQKRIGYSTDNLFVAYQRKHHNQRKIQFVAHINELLRDVL